MYNSLPLPPPPPLYTPATHAQAMLRVAKIEIKKIILKESLWDPGIVAYIQLLNKHWNSLVGRQREQRITIKLPLSEGTGRQTRGAFGSLK